MRKAGKSLRNTQRQQKEAFMWHLETVLTVWDWLTFIVTLLYTPSAHVSNTKKKKITGQHKPLKHQKAEILIHLNSETQKHPVTVCKYCALSFTRAVFSESSHIKWDRGFASSQQHRVKWTGITGKELLMGEATVHPPSNLIYTNSTYGTLMLHVNESLTINGK